MAAARSRHYIVITAGYVLGAALFSRLPEQKHDVSHRNLLDSSV